MLKKKKFVSQNQPVNLHCVGVGKRESHGTLVHTHCTFAQSVCTLDTQFYSKKIFVLFGRELRIVRTCMKSLSSLPLPSCQVLPGYVIYFMCVLVFLFCFEQERTLVRLCMSSRNLSLLVIICCMCLIVFSLLLKVVEFGSF